MQLLKIYSENLYSFLNLELDLTKYSNGTTIILGKNLDMDSSNGAGKSNILKIIYFALWGADHEAVPLEKLIHDQSDGSFLVYLDFSDGQDMFRIIRFANYTKDAPISLPNGKKIKGKGTILLINGEEPFESKEAGKTSVQSLISNKLGMSPDIFLNSVYTPQERKKPFLKASDGDKKEVLSEILDLNYYDDAAKILDADIKSKTSLLQSYDKKIELNTQKRDDLKKNLNELELKINQISKEYVSKKDELRTKIGELKADILQLSSVIDDTNVVDLGSVKVQINALKDKILLSEKNLKDKDKVLTLKAKLQSEITNFDKNKGQVEAAIQEINKDHSVLSEELNNIDSSSLVDYSPQIQEKQAKVILKKNKELELKKIVEIINLLSQDLTKIELLFERNSKDKLAINEEIIKINEENACQTCSRTFNEGESSLLDQMLVKKKNELESLELKFNDFTLKKETILQKYNSHKNKQQLTEQEINELLPIEKELQELMILDEKNRSLKEKIQSLKQRIVALEMNKKKKEDEAVALSEDNGKNKLKLDEILPLLSLLEKEEEKLRSFRSNLEIVQKELSDKELSNQKLSSLMESKKNKEDLLSGMNSRLSELENNRKSYQDLYNRQKEELKLCEQIEEETVAKSNDQKEELKYLLFWEKGFSKTGIRSFIIDDVIEFLNQKVKENLEVLSNGTTSLMFEPENKGKTTGVVSNNIITKLFVNGRERLLKLHSGGEAERYTIAVELALSDLAESRSGTKFNIRFLDEPFTAFDTKPQLKSFALFNKAAGEKQGFFIISHNKEFQQYCDNSIYVVKQDGVSRLVDQATFINIGENL